MVFYELNKSDSPLGLRCVPLGVQQRWTNDL